MSRYEDVPEDLVKRDDKVRKYQFEQLKRDGVQRARDVTDHDGIPVPGGRTIIPLSGRR